MTDISDDIGIVGGLQTWLIPDVVVNQDAVLKFQGFSSGYLHGFMEEEGGVEVVTGAGSARRHLLAHEFVPTASLPKRRLLPDFPN